MSATGTEPGGASNLRQRGTRHLEKPGDPSDVQFSKDVRFASNTQAPNEDGDGVPQKTFGRTPDGTVFTVPETHDMVSQLLSPSQPKNLSDLLILTLLGLHIALLFILPSSVKIPILAIVFLFWRGAYNAGIGLLLQGQSNNNQMVNWAKLSGVFQKPEMGKNPHPKLRAFLKKEMETKIPKDYKFEDAPLEYNTWLVFRRVVDVILMCDFTSYCLFAIACGGRPVDESLFMTASRWIAGLLLFLFNLWVKLDAHRVVKDYAWYWGDFFYLIDQELTFDGVFEMAPHPMYSVGYAGYYGISLMAASYKVLLISVIAHASQFAFLTLIENPHIEKTYNPPAPRKRTLSGLETVSIDKEGTDATLASAVTSVDPSKVHNLLGGVRNLDLHRVTDLSVLILQFYAMTLAVMTPSTALYQILFVANAVFWRLWYTLGVGYVLDRQSKKKSWTRHFIKYGENSEEAWRQWKGFYHLSMNMCYASFVAAAWKMYHLPPDWSYGMVLLRHVIGAGLLSLHIWTAISIYDSLGEFGWFYGDFFYDQAPKLTYSGIYRFLNNPERFFGLAGVWAAAVLTWSRAIFLLAVLSHILMLAFLQFVERPHMQRLYGESVRRQSGLSKSFRRSLPPPIRQWQGKVDRGFERATDHVEELIEWVQSRLFAGMGNLVNDSKTLINKSASRMNITRISDDVADFDINNYGISIEGTPSSSHAWLDRRSGREGADARMPPRRTSDFKTKIFEYGAPITVRWTAPAKHASKDWIGLYMVSDNASRDVTKVASRGRWISTVGHVYDTSHADIGIISSNMKVEKQRGVSGEDLVTGEMEFSGDKLWWTTGVFEFRYHHDGKHNVMTQSIAFEIRIGRFDEDDVSLEEDLQTAVERALLPVVRNCFDRDPEIAPSTIDEEFGSLVERDGKFAKRVVFAVHQMFGIEFAPEVVMADGNVKNLAWRVCNAKKVLAPYSMSSKGRTTPSEVKY